MQRTKSGFRAITKIGILTIAFLLCGDVRAYPQNKGDWQVWTRNAVEVPLEGGPYSISFEQDFRLGDDAGKLLYEHSEVGGIYKKTEWLTLSLNYRYIRKINDDVWEGESRMHGNVTVRVDWMRLHISDRSRIEFRALSRTKDIWRYRNKIRIRMPFNKTRFNISPYAADEFFIDLDQNKFNYQRVSGGLEFTLTDRLEGEIYYLWQNAAGRGTVAGTNVIGTELKFVF